MGGDWRRCATTTALPAPATETAVPRLSVFRYAAADIADILLELMMLELMMLAVLAPEEQDERDDTRLTSEDPAERRGACWDETSVMLLLLPMSALVRRRMASASAATGEPPRSPRRGEVWGERVFRLAIACSGSPLGVPVMGARHREGKLMAAPFFSVLRN